MRLKLRLAQISLIKKVLTLCIYFIPLVLISQNNELSKSDLKFYKELIQTFKQNSINKDSIDWNSFEKIVLEKAKISKDSAIITALTLNGVRHSYYYKMDSKESLIGEFEIDNFKNEINNSGYIKIKSFTPSRTNLNETIENAKNYITTNFNSISVQDKKKLTCWIIDLRDNSGGDMWPMIISLAPFLANGKFGATVKNNETINWTKNDGEIFYGKLNKTWKYIRESENYHLKNNKVKIAVLINSRTASSGEATAIALMANPNVKFFGNPSFGFASNNTSYKMKNGDYLNLTTAFWTDFNGNRIDKINPMITSGSEKEMVDQIKEWIQTN